MCAIYVGNLSLVEKAVSAGADLFSDESWALSHAASRNQVEIMDFLVSKGVSLDVSGGKALVSSLESGASAAVDWLSEKGFHLSSSQAYEVLSLSSSKGNAKSLGKALAALPEDVHALSHALIASVKAGHHDCVDMLVRSGASVSFRSHAGENPLLSAVKLGDAVSVRLMSRRHIPEGLKSEAMGFANGSLSELISSFKTINETHSELCESSDSERMSLLRMVERSLKTPEFL